MQTLPLLIGIPVLEAVVVEIVLEHRVNIVTAEGSPIGNATHRATGIK